MGSDNNVNNAERYHQWAVAVIDSCLAKSQCWALNNNMKVSKSLTKIQKEQYMNL